MQSIKYTIENYPSFETVEDKRLTVESDPQEFIDLIRLFSDHRPHLLEGEQVKAACLSRIPNSGKPAKLSRDCFSVEVYRNGDISVFCQYTTTHSDGDRLHTYLLSSYVD